MNDEAIVPLRPGFDNEFRGFSRNQVLEHIELLEDQVRILITDRDEAIRLNEDQRRITDDTRRRMDEMAAELKRIESSETGLPHATRRMQNMLTMADQEASSIREDARRDAETIRGTASTDAEQIRREAESQAESLRNECAALVDDLERRRERLDEEHSARMSEAETQRAALNESARTAYEQAVASGQQEATELLRKTGERCEQMESDSRGYHDRVMRDLETRASDLENARQLLVDTLETVGRFAEAHRSELTKHLAPIRAELEGQRLDAEEPRTESLPDQRAAALETAESVPGRSRIPIQLDQEPVRHNDNGPQPVDSAADLDGLDDEVPLLHQSPVQPYGVGAASTHAAEHRN